MRFDHNDPYVFTQMEAHIAYLESEVDILNECLTEANKTISQLEDKISTLESGRKQFERESRERIRREECNHDWGPEEWTWSCGGYRKCRKCGAVKEFYERD